MEDIKKRKQIKKRYIVLIAALIVFSAIVIFFFQFTSIGYRMTVPLRGFTESAANVYIHKDFTDNAEEAVKTVDEAKKRVKEYFGEIKSDPMLIICDDEDTIIKLGGDHDTSTLVIFKAFSYIVLSSEFLNVDVVAHEMTHAEVHTRIFNGKVWYRPLIPTWFDEGVAIQNDYREIYNEDAWRAATDDGKNVIALNDMDTAAKFYAGETEERRYRYIVSKHELSGWIDHNGIDALLDLLDKVNKGEDFNDLYFTK